MKSKLTFQKKTATTGIIILALVAATISSSCFSNALIVVSPLSVRTTSVVVTSSQIRKVSTQNQQQQHVQQQGTPTPTTKLFLSNANVVEEEEGEDVDVVPTSSSFNKNKNTFDLETALFCGGLAFDAYTEPPANSSRWERGSKGMNVAFVSTAFTRNLYKGLVEVTPQKCSGLPSEDDNAEALMSGGGIDATLLVAAVEGNWKEDIDMLQQEYHEGIMDLSGATHVGRSRTAWSNINENKSKAVKKKTGKGLAYHIPKKWGTAAKAVWEDEDPFYLYVQDPKTVRLVFTLWDEDVVGEGSAIGSTSTLLSKLLPQAATYSQKELVSKLKTEILQRIKSGDVDPENIDDEVAKALSGSSGSSSGAGAVAEWEGDLRLTSKPRIKNKNGQIAAGMAAGAMVGGPLGAAVGAAVGSMYEGQVQGTINVKLRYLPLPETNVPRKRYQVLGGLPGVNWGNLYEEYLKQHKPPRPPIDDDTSSSTSSTSSPEELAMIKVGGNDLEHCFFINHDMTGGCCAVYRSLERKLIVVSFRGTCTPIDLVTDASIVQEPWVEGEDEKSDDTAKVHVGFRKSMNSIARRLKEMILATVEPGDRIEDYDMLITGHSLGGALATLFAADIGEYGIDAGRALPQTDPSDAWWKTLSNTFMGKQAQKEDQRRDVPRPKSLRVYTFGSPRVGNTKFSQRFQKLVESSMIDQAYRIVNDQDVVARLPRTMYTLSVDYDHCGSTVLVVSDEETMSTDDEEVANRKGRQVLWIEGESDDQECPVRDYNTRISSPTGEGTLLGDLFSATSGAFKKGSGSSGEGGDDGGEKGGGGGGYSLAASKFTKRLSAMTAADITSLIGIDRTFSEREMKIMKSLFKGEGLAHHMEDSYYAAMGRAGGFIAAVGEDIVPMTTTTTAVLPPPPTDNEGTTMTTTTEA